jgi:hypothetical protein
MKTIATLSVLLLGALSIKAGIRTDVSIAAQMEITRASIPFSCRVNADADGAIKLVCALNEPFGVVGTFTAYELRVLKSHVSTSDLNRNAFFRLDLIARRETVRSKDAVFVVTKEEIPNSYIVVSSWIGQNGAIPILQSICVPVPGLLNRGK